ncbi:DUF5666 domain-containing protein [Thermoflexus sp.]|uniref:DUF5666 domain-containing protein n=1 Tax=Thermoflexus sp. TaxID=1969742 RepID=UPI0017E6B745|nr:DUF5666 domain-containing protein [Thermoflexus sp.]
MRRIGLWLLILGWMLLPVGTVWAQGPSPTATPALGRPVLVRGSITAVGDHSITLNTERWGTLEVQIREATRFHVPGFVRADLSEVRVGDRATVHGRWLEEGRSLEAHWVIIRGPVQVRHGHVVRIDVAARRLEMKTRAGETIPVEWTAHTRLHVTGVISPTWSDIGVGYPVTVIGHFVEGTFLAGRVIARRPHRLFHGTLQGVEGNTLVIQTREGEQVRLVTDAHTRIRIPGHPHATLADLQVGDILTARAVGNPDGTWLARTVIARSPKLPKPGAQGPKPGAPPTRRP